MRAPSRPSVRLVDYEQFVRLLLEQRS
jgi:hypothetical protein